MKSNVTLATFPDSCFLDKCLVKLENEITTTQDLFYFDITFWICFAIMVIIGIPFNFGLVHYEKFGGDPQKRSLTNRLTSSSIICSTVAGFAIQTLTAMMR